MLGNWELTNSLLADIEIFVIAVFFWMLFVDILVFSIGFIKKKKRGFLSPIFKYSPRNVFLYLLALSLGVVWGSIILDNWSFFFMFIVVGLLGIIGESAYSWVWKLYFKRKNWEYTELPIFNSYTSLYNVIPWGIGGVVFLGCIAVMSKFTAVREIIDTSIIALYFSVFLGLSFIVGFGILRKIFAKKDFIKFSLKNFLIFNIPILNGIFIISLLYGWEYFIFSILSAFTAFVLEYLYGRMLHWIFGRQFWFYNYIPIDGNHTSITNYFGAMIGGYIFLLVFLVGIIVL